MTDSPQGAVDIAPGRVLVAGDWHGNRYWALNVIHRVPQLLAGEQRPLIVHLRDFGIWPDDDGRRYLTAVSTALGQVNAELWFIDGNHEDFTQLASGAADPAGRIPLRPNIYHVPRGYRWDWHGRRWLACGGGVSLDQAVRRPGHDWWPQEEITGEQEAAIIGGGAADVMVCHDCPAGVPHSFPPPAPEPGVPQLSLPVPVRLHGWSGSQGSGKSRKREVQDDDEPPDRDAGHGLRAFGSDATTRS